MKTCSRSEYVEYVRSHPELRDHITEGTNLSAVQWLDAETGTVRAQALYEKIGGVVGSSYWRSDEN